jgi:mono/diheme cytochrome c family protein
MSPVRVKGLRRAIWCLLGGAVLALLVVGCIPTTFEYPVDFYNEMHYQQSYRRQEPPVVPVPTGVVPINGGEPVLPTDAYTSYQNPIPRTPANMQAAAALYQRNCRPCHGVQGKGDGIVGLTMRGYPGAPVPADYSDPAVAALTDGQIYGVLTNGKRNEQTLQGMPSFRSMLTSDQRWSLVNQVRAFQGK